MKILIITPSLRLHGGIRVLVEWANHLQRRGHDVTLQVESGQMSAEWIDIDEGVMVRPGFNWTPTGYDVAVAGTPFIALRLDAISMAGKKFFLLQMAEDLFSPDNRAYVDACRRGYKVKMPIIGISKWVEEYVRQWRGDAKMYYIGNGVSSEFKPKRNSRDKKLTILVECWEGYNPAKDIKHFGPKAAKHLKDKYKARIISYGQDAIKTMKSIPNEYHQRIGTQEIVNLCRRATIMVKATRFDARSTACVEAGACGTVTARAIEKGDDDLLHEYNCLRGDYDLDKLIHNAEKLIEDETLRNKLEKNFKEYRKTYLSWDFWMEIVEGIFEEDDQEITAPPQKFWAPKRRGRAL